MWNEMAALAFPVLFGASERAEGIRGRSHARRAPDDIAPSRHRDADAGDLALVALIREGTEASARREFDLLYERLFERLFKFAMRMAHDPDIACDTVQDAFVALWVGRATWHAPGGSTAYLYTAIRNRLVTRVRRQRVVHRANPAQLPTPSTPTIPDVAAEHSEFDVAFREALLALPERRQSAFLLHAVDGLSYETIGEILGISKPAAFKQVAVAISALRNRLARFAG